MATISNKTKLTFTVTYSILSDELAKIVNLVGANFVLVPVMNDVDAYTYKNSSGASKSFKDLFSTWGTSFDTTKFSSLTPQWYYGTGVAAGTNSVTYTTSDYDNYITDTDGLGLSTWIKFGVYKATVTDNVYTPTGSRITTIDYSDLVAVSCQFTDETGKLLPPTLSITDNLQATFTVKVTNPNAVDCDFYSQDIETFLSVPANSSATFTLSWGSQTTHTVTGYLSSSGYTNSDNVSVVVTKED